VRQLRANATDRRSGMVPSRHSGLSIWFLVARLSANLPEAAARARHGRKPPINPANAQQAMIG
jgi:hypothetical protein